MSGIVWFILGILYLLDTHFEFSYSLVAPYLTWTSGEWYKGLAIFMAGVAIVAEQYEFRKLPRGVVIRDGILLVKKNAVLPFRNIASIKVSQQRNTAVVQTAENEVEVAMDEREIVKLPRAGFTQWSIDKESADIARGPAGAALFAAYPPTGKYAGGSVAVIALAFAAGVVLLLYFDIVGLWFALIGLLLSFLLAIIYNTYKEVAVTIEQDGIKLKDENLAEHFMAFAEIAKVEKNRVRTRLTAKDGRVLRLPRALYLMPEFIAEYAKPGKT